MQPTYPPVTYIKIKTRRRHPAWVRTSLIVGALLVILAMVIYFGSSLLWHIPG
jgi:hypothetical protein